MCVCTTAHLVYNPPIPPITSYHPMILRMRNTLSRLGLFLSSLRRHSRPAGVLAPGREKPVPTRSVVDHLRDAEGGASPRRRRRLGQMKLVHVPYVSGRRELCRPGPPLSPLSPPPSPQRGCQHSKPPGIAQASSTSLYSGALPRRLVVWDCFSSSFFSCRLARYEIGRLLRG